MDLMGDESEMQRPYFLDAKFNDMDHPWNYDMPNVRVISKVFTTIMPGDFNSRDPVYKYYLRQMKEYKVKIEQWLGGDMNSIDTGYVRSEKPIRYQIHNSKTAGNENKFRKDINSHSKSAQRDPNVEISLECQFPILEDMMANPEHQSEGSPIELINGGWRVDIVKNEIRRLGPTYVKLIDRIIRSYKSEWKASNTIDIDLVIEAALMMGELVCGKYDIINGFYYKNWRGNKLPQEGWDMIYPILNHTGHFAYNSFLYAFFNNVIIYGIPSEISTADGIVYCPTDFIIHDLNHTNVMVGYEFAGNTSINPYSMVGLRKYLQILYDHHLSLYGKIDDKRFELGLFTLWWFIHEGIYWENDEELFDRANVRLVTAQENQILSDDVQLYIKHRSRQIRESERRQMYIDDTTNASMEDAVDFYNEYVEEEKVRLIDVYQPRPNGRPRLIRGGFDYLDYAHDINTQNQVGDFIDHMVYIDVVRDHFKEHYPKDIIPYEYPPYNEYVHLLDAYDGKIEKGTLNDYITAAYIFVGMDILRWDLVQESLDLDYGM